MNCVLVYYAAMAWRLLQPMTRYELENLTWRGRLLRTIPLVTAFPVVCGLFRLGQIAFFKLGWIKSPIGTAVLGALFENELDLSDLKRLVTPRSDVVGLGLSGNQETHDAEDTHPGWRG